MLKGYNYIKIQVIAMAFFISAVVNAQMQKEEFTPSVDDNWLVNVDEAYALSKETNRPIMANFTGSDWCGWCKKLRREVFDTPEFKSWAAENVILLELDFPRRKQLPEQQVTQNRSLQQAFRVTGFPTIWVFDLDKNTETKQYQLQAYGKTGYLPGGPANYTKQLDKMLDKKKD